MLVAVFSQFFEVKHFAPLTVEVLIQTKRSVQQVFLTSISLIDEMVVHVCVSEKEKGERERERMERGEGEREKGITCRKIETVEYL